MNKVVQLFLAGVLVIAAVKLFGFEKQITDKVVSNVKSGEPERIVLGAVLTLALGMVAVIGAQMFRKVT